MKKISLLLVLLFSSTSLVYFKQELNSPKNHIAEIKTTPIYLPETKYVRMISLGFDNFLSDLLWFNTINYFGEHFASDKDFRWFAHMCDLVTELDKRKIEQVEFCSTLTAWIAKQPRKSERLLSKAIANHPNYWRFRYLRGFTNWYFLNNNKKAKVDFTIAAQLPDAPKIFLSSYASRLMISEGKDPDTAIAFLQDMVKNTGDKSAKKALGDQLKRAVMSKQVQIMERARAIYQKRFAKEAKSIKDLQDAKILTGEARDPYGGAYYIDLKTSEILSSSKVKPLNFAGRNAKTGIAKKEFANETFDE